MALSYLAELPFGKGHNLAPIGMPARLFGGWNVSVLFVYGGGLPLAITAPVPGGGDRPNSTGQSATLPGGRPLNARIEEWFNTSVFTLPPSYTFGNVSRTLPNTRGPSVTNVDLAVVRNIAIGEHLDLQIRGEAFT